MSVYVTKAGDTADLICMELYGRTAEVTEALLEANPGLAARGAVLPAGLTLNVPAAPDTRRRAPTRLWD